MLINKKTTNPNYDSYLHHQGRSNTPLVYINRTAMGLHAFNPVTHELIGVYKDMNQLKLRTLNDLEAR